MTIKPPPIWFAWQSIGCVYLAGAQHWWLFWTLAVWLGASIAFVTGRAFQGAYRRPRSG